MVDSLVCEAIVVFIKEGSCLFAFNSLDSTSSVIGVYGVSMIDEFSTGGVDSALCFSY